ncbi:hypothetical protein NUW58_g6938 [Xylaria curta]|uniref:Uncharacterized protein n=1 Tax=Xylaria curta TaxID=42375 RepID=A0ACC1NMZ7_9PEZI|nr:hypothetical protein NUW58_g6938 [Xylaria curta]
MSPRPDDGVWTTPVPHDLQANNVRRIFSTLASARPMATLGLLARIAYKRSAMVLSYRPFDRMVAAGELTAHAGTTRPSEFHRAKMDILRPLICILPMAAAFVFRRNGSGLAMLSSQRAIYLTERGSILSDMLGIGTAQSYPVALFSTSDLVSKSKAMGRGGGQSSGDGH